VEKLSSGRGGSGILQGDTKCGEGMSREGTAGGKEVTTHKMDFLGTKFKSRDLWGSASTIQFFSVD